MTNGQKVSDMVENIETIRLKNSTRGVSNTLTVSSSIITKEKFDAKVYSKEMNADHWAKIRELLSGLDLNDIKELKVNSKQHQVDAAMAEVFTVVIDGRVYNSPTYDAGNPPSEIKEVVNYIKSLDAKK